MYLYEDKISKINVYEMKENKEAVKEYRKKEMKKIKEGQEVLFATGYYIEDNEVTFLNRVKYYDVVDAPFNCINGKSVYGTQNELLVSSDMKDEEKNILLNKFYNGEFDKSSILKLLYQICDNRYLLLTEEQTKKISYHKEKMDNIIEIPKSLYLLQMLNKKRFDLIQDENLSEILSLYEISCIEEINVEELLKSEKYGILPSGFSSNLINAMKKDQIMIKKIKPLVK